MNQLFLIGRLTEQPLLQKINEKSRTTICLIVKRDFKNEIGVYSEDFIKCELNGVIAERVCECCKKNDLISVKARVENLSDNAEEFNYKIVGKQVSFMQSQSK